MDSKIEKCNDKIGFVILHYQLLEQTIECVNSVFKNVPGAFVVIVDNCSPNGSGNELETLYRDNESVHCLLLKENLGFAKGNNVGYSYLREKQEFKFICCINNDTLIIQKDFLEKVEKEFALTRFAVMAPLALQKDKSVQSFAPTLRSVDEYKKELEKWQNNSTFESYLNDLDGKTRFLLKYPRIAAKIRKIKQMISCPYAKRMEDVVLHGCFLIFSKCYIEKFDTAFDESTFMYREEELLFLRIRANNLKSLYCPDLIIRHIENSSTNKEYSEKEKKYRFLRENQIKSLTILINALECNK